MIEDWQNGGFGLYVHWPFCASKCPYCDFNSHVATSIDQARWADAYRAEIARVWWRHPLTYGTRNGRRRAGSRARRLDFRQ